jgi:putative methyltransferase (TIGR04325 family)
MTRRQRAHTIRRWIPPVVLDLIRHLRRRSEEPPEWEYRPAGWSHGAELRGWDAASVAAAQRMNWDAYKAVLEDAGPLGVIHTDAEPNGESVQMHNTVMGFAYSLALAAADRPAVSLLDWGGGVGHYYPLARALLTGTAIQYTCLDVPTLCATGRTLNTDAEFVSDAADLAGRRFDFVLSSSSLQYAERWRETLATLATLTRGYLLVTRLPIVWNVPSFVVVQRPYWVYDTEYQGWFLNRLELLEAATSVGLQLVRELALDEAPDVPGAPEQCRYRGFLFRPQATLANTARQAQP